MACDLAVEALPCASTNEAGDAAFPSKDTGGAAALIEIKRGARAPGMWPLGQLPR
jgi:hypothetical protein